MPPDNTYKFDANCTDDELVDTITHWTKNSQPFHDTMLAWQNKAVRYYLGDQTDLKEVPAYLSDTVYNRIFEATETIVPIVTGTSQQFLVEPAMENEQSIHRASRLQKVLSKKYETLDIQGKIEVAVRDIIVKRFGVLEWFWNSELDDVDVRVRDPRSVMIPKLRVPAHKLPYVQLIEEYSKDEMLTFFPECDINSLPTGMPLAVGLNIDTPYMGSFGAGNGTYGSAGDSTFLEKYQVIATWSDTYVSWSIGDIILKRMPNPYWDWGTEEKEMKEVIDSPLGKVRVDTEHSKKNFLPRPMKPIVFLAPFLSGDAPVALQSLVEVAIPIQDDINTSKRKIQDNLIRLGNGQVVADSGVFTDEELNAITNEPGLIIVGKGAASENRVRREPGVALPNAHFSNLQASLAAFDNVFGVHATTRGQGQGGTLGGQVINRQQDLSRIEQITRCVNRGIAEVANGIVQMMKLYYDEKKVIRIVGEEGAIEFVKFSADDIEPDAVVNVKSGTPAVMDPVGRYNQAIQLWQLGAIDPETFFQRLDFPDPSDSAKKLAAWKAGQLVLESELRMGEAAAGAQIRNKESAPGEPGVETANQVVARAEQDMGTGPATLPKPPKM